MRRNSCDGGSPVWDPENGSIDLAGVNDIEAVVHLAGDNISKGRWNDKKKRRIIDSRVRGTELLADYFAGSEHKPRIIVSASAVGFYGDRGDKCVDETSVSGEGFLADVCRQWEGAMASAVDAGVRVVNVRLGLVLSSAGGALKKMLLPFRMGLGGVIGSGRQYVSWMSIDDVIGGIRFVMENESMRGPVNLVAPNAVSNREFTEALGRVLHRPTVFPMPAFVAQAVFGEMANDLLLASTRAVPRELLDNGYKFLHPEIGRAFEYLLG